MFQLDDTKTPTMPLEEALARGQQEGLDQEVFEVFAFAAQEEAAKLPNPRGSKKARTDKFDARLVELCNKVGDPIPVRFRLVADQDVRGNEKWYFRSSSLRLHYKGTGSDGNRYLARVFKDH
ncbi:MAG: hypothetical protein AAGD01_17335 [Acidobacteriota bacterium]